MAKATFSMPLSLGTRVYSEEALRKAVEAYQERVRDGSAFGTIAGTELTSSLAAVSHVVTELSVRDGAVHAVVELLDTPNGRLVKALLGAGCDKELVPRGSVSMEGALLLSGVDVAVLPRAKDG